MGRQIRSSLKLDGLIDRQPYGVWYPLTLIGVLLTALLGGLLPVVRGRYREAENRRLDAESLRRG